MKQEFGKLSWEQKRIKEIVKYIQICIRKREQYEGYRKNPNDKIYMMMNRKDVEAYQKSYEEIDIFLKQFPHLKDMVLGEMRSKSGKNLFRKLNKYSKDLQVKQEEIIKKHNSLSAEYDELEHLKNNMDDYLDNEKTLEIQPKKSIIKQIADMSERGQKACNKKIKIEKMKDKTGFYFKRKHAIILYRISMQTNRKEECYEIFIQ